jgi:ionotropic glutamate receptor
MMQVEDENNGFHFEGYCVDLIEEIRKLVGFEYEIYVAPDNKFGNMDENGQWNGMIKELTEKVPSCAKISFCYARVLRKFFQ